MAFLGFNSRTLSKGHSVHSVNVMMKRGRPWAETSHSTDWGTGGLALPGAWSLHGFT